MYRHWHLCIFNAKLTVPVFDIPKTIHVLKESGLGPVKSILAFDFGISYQILENHGVQILIGNKYLT